VKKIFGLVIVATVLSMFATSSVTAANPEPAVSYSFEGNLDAKSEGSTLTLSPPCPEDPCNDTTTFGVDGEDGYWSWTSTDSDGGGFTIDTEQNLTPTYTILVKFTFDSYDGYNKIIDFQNRTKDTGLYMDDELINFYNIASSTNSFVAGEPLTMMFTRSSTGPTSALLTIYTFDGTNVIKQFEATEEDGESLPFESTVHPGGTKLGFFYDNGNGEGASSGKAYSLKIWPGVALSLDDLQVVNTAPEPEPEPEPTPEERSQELADTGYEPTLLLSLALALLMLGFGILRISKRF